MNCFASCLWGGSFKGQRTNRGQRKCLLQPAHEICHPPPATGGTNPCNESSAPNRETGKRVPGRIVIALLLRPFHKPSKCRGTKNNASSLAIFIANLAPPPPSDLPKLQPGVAHCHDDTINQQLRPPRRPRLAKLDSSSICHCGNHAEAGPGLKFSGRSWRWYIFVLWCACLARFSFPDSLLFIFS